MKRTALLQLGATLGAAMTLGMLMPPAAHAQDSYPSKTLRFVVPYPPGGPTDLMARLLSVELQNRPGVTVIVDNKGGAEVAKQSPADGHTLLLAASGPMAVNSTLFRSMPFNPLTDLAPAIDKLNSTLNAIFKEPEFHKKREALGTPVVGGTAAQFGELIKKETVRLGKVVKDSGVTLD
jgi:tripartite-type tricarboxylate transporter receptor subunit TctC